MVVIKLRNSKVYVRTVFLGFLILSILVLLSLLFSGSSCADKWSDDFTGYSLDPRWVEGGEGTVGFDGETNLLDSSYDAEYMIPWHGPYVRANISPSSNFSVFIKLNCIAEVTTVGRVEARLLDAEGSQIYSFGWFDTSPNNNLASINLRGRNNASVLFTTGESYTYTIFAEQSVTLVRNGTTLSFYINGVLKYEGITNRSTISAVELAFLKYEELCPPESITFDLISLESIPITVPGEPTNLTCASGDGVVTLDWHEPAFDGGVPITSYNVYRGVLQGSTNYLTTVGNQLNYTDYNLENGQKYYYTVSALNEVGEGARSIETNGTSKTIPGAPQNLQAFAGDDFILLTWAPPLVDGGSAISNYMIYRAVSNESRTELATLGIQLTYNDTGLSYNSTYSYIVTAVNEVGEGPSSSEAISSTGSPKTIPSAPRELIAFGGNGKITLSWLPPISTGNLPIVNYTIYKGNTSDQKVFFTMVGNVLSYVDTSVTNNETYYYWISASNDVGEGSFSNEIYAIPRSDTVPTAPTNLSAVVSSDQIVLSWSKPETDGGTQILNYVIFRGNGPNDLASLTVVGYVHSYTDTGVVQGQVYYYRVRAVNAVGEGAFSVTVNVTIPLSDGGDPDGSSNEDLTVGAGDNWSVTSAIITILLLVMGFLFVVVYMRKPAPPRSE